MIAHSTVVSFDGMGVRCQSRKLRALWRQLVHIALGVGAFGFSLARADGPDAAAPVRQVTVFGGIYTSNRLLELIGVEPQSVKVHGDTWIAGVAGGQTLGTPGTYWRWEAEGQGCVHFGKQNHLEFNGLVIGRWLRFPWDRLVDTSVAVGEGLSFATQVPEIEPRADREAESTRLLNYLMIEVELAPSPTSRWCVVGRIHHRSGVFGLFDGIHGGSNFIVAGVRHRFW